MQVHRSIDHLPLFTRAVVTIGTFDGVHLGHRKIIDALKRETESVKGESVIISFHPHPRKIVHPHETLQLINTPEEKISLLAQSDIDHLVIVPFNLAFAEQSADDYIKEFLIRKFNPNTIIIGYDHHFGRDRRGNYLLLEEKAPVFQYRLVEIPKYLLDEVGVSSTKIRKAILSSDVDTANRLLGYDFYFSGRVIKGDQLGRELGYPTANLEYEDPDKIHLGEGVFVCQVEIGNKIKMGMLSVGNRPTVSGKEERVEVNIFDFDDDIYGKELKVVVKKFLRSQEKYANLEELKKQMARDRENTIQYFQSGNKK